MVHSIEPLTATSVDTDPSFRCAYYVLEGPPQVSDRSQI